MKYIEKFNLTKEKIIILGMGIIITCLCFILVYLINNKKVKIVEREVMVEKNDCPKEEEKIKVDIKGEIKNPGVYEVSTTDRVNDLISLAGGLLKTSDVSTINLSKKLNDQDVIIVYTRNEVWKMNNAVKVEEKKVETTNEIINSATIKEYINNNQKSDNKISINTATLEQLQTLNGIGESKAKDIIEYRSTTKFNTIEDIKNVSGIGNALFEKIKNDITT